MIRNFSKRNDRTGKKRKSGKRSGYEEHVAKGLEERNVPYEYEAETLFYIKPPVPAKEGRYTPDFTIKKKDGSLMYIESKGRFSAADRKKMALVKAQNPDADIRLLFMRDDYLTSKKKSKNSTWAAKHGFPWAVSYQGWIPDRWLEE